MICGKSELCIFDKAPAQAVVDSAIFADIHPTTLIEGDNIEFHINGSQTEYLDLNDTLLYVRLRVVNKSGSVLAADADITPSSYLLNALFSDVTLSLNDTVIEGGNRLYPYKATIESIFNFTEDTKDIQLHPAGYNDDAAQRKLWLKASREFELAGALRLDFLNQPKYLLPGINVRMQLQKSKPNFALTVASGASQPQVEIKKAILYVRRVKVNPAVLLGHQIGLKTQNAHYPISKSQIISYTIAKGSMSYFKDNVFSSLRLPKFVVVGFVDARGFNGNYQLEPFRFDDFGVNSIGLYRDGQAIPYRDIYEPDFTGGHYTRDYVMSIIHNTEHLNRNLNNGITMDMFAKGGYSLFTFNLTPDFSIAQVQQPTDGNLRLDIKFAQALPEAINVIVYGLFDDEIQITGSGEIIK